MAFVHNVRTVAHYEAKTLRRSWFFRLFSIIALIIFTMLNIGMFSPAGSESWETIGIASALPHINIYILNLAQAIVIIFLAADFLKRDKKLDTNEVLYTRSMSNMEYILGKTIGILRLFLGLNLIILMIAMLINIISPLMKVDIISYIAHLLMISVPTLVFSLGFAFLLMSVVRNQAITFLLLLGYAAMVVFYLFYRAGYIFDYMAFGLPLFRSDIIGYDNFSYIFFQRMFYFSVGITCVMITIIIFKRLPQSAIQNSIAKVLLVVFAITAGFSGWRVLNEYVGDKKDKKLTIETNARYESARFATITNADLDVEHQGEKITVRAGLTLRNDHDTPIRQFILSLNPSMKISSVTDENGNPLQFKREFNIAEIDPSNPLAEGESGRIFISYSGSINESFCYPWYTDDIRQYPSRIGIVSVNKRQAFLTDDYVLLTPETHWYPVAALNYYPSNPARIKIDFTQFALNVKTGSHLTALTQGTSTGSDGNWQISHETPLTGVTLAIGNYLTDTISAGGIKYKTHYFPGNDYYKSVFNEIADTLPSLLNVLMTEIETGFSTKYPFPTLSFIEVPVQFFSYPRKNTQTRAELQPSMILLPERLVTLGRQAGFSRNFKRQKRDMERRNQIITDKELQVRLFNNFARTTFISGANFRFTAGNVVNEPSRYMLRPSFYFFKNNFYSDDFPVINSVFESHLQKVSNQMMRGVQGVMGGLSETDIANLRLRGKSLKQILNESPSADTLRMILTVKGDYLFNMMRAKAGIEEFKTWFTEYLDNNMFTRIDIRKFDKDLLDSFGFSLTEYLPNWFEGYDIPGFIISEPRVTEVVIDERSRYQVTFTASNPEPAPGLFNITFRTGGGMAGGRGGGGGGGGMAGGAATFSATGAGGMQRIEIAMQGRGMDVADISGIVFLDGNQAKRISLISETQPRAMVVNTVMAKNIPGELTFIFGQPEKAPRGTIPFEGEEILPSLPLFTEENEIIVDNEDPGFARSQVYEASPIKRILGITNTDGEGYAQMRPTFLPEYWQPVVMSDYYGKYIKSAVYTKSGNGERHVSWTAVIPAPGYYDVYAFIPKSGNRMMQMARQIGDQMVIGGPGGGQGGQPGGAPGGQVTVTDGQGRRGERGNQTPMMKEFNFTVFHDDGNEEIVIDFETAEPGWNKLGSYYISSDSAKVELNNKSTARMVVGDAVKWVKLNNR